MKKISLIISCMMLILLFGCNKEKKEEKIDLKGETGYITSLSKKNALIGEVSYSIDDKTIIEEAGDKLKLADLAVGMKVNVENEGTLLDSYPSQGKAKKIVVLTDKASKKEQKAVKAVLDMLGKDNQSLLIKSVTYIKADKAYEIDLTLLTKTDQSNIVLKIDEKTNEILYK